jgi:hypothetical protein
MKKCIRGIQSFLRCGIVLPPLGFSRTEAYRGPQSFGVAVEIAFFRRAGALHLYQPSEDGVPDSKTHFRHMAMGTLPPISDLVVGNRA